MSEDNVAVFFYGLFMDEALLISKGIEPASSNIGYLDGYRLRIGKRATLVPEEGCRAYGVLMVIRREQATALYSDQTVADYVPEPVSVTLTDGGVEGAVCYNLPPGKLEGANSAYAKSLLRVAARLRFPEEYLNTIRMQGGRPE